MGNAAIVELAHVKRQLLQATALTDVLECVVVEVAVIKVSGRELSQLGQKRQIGGRLEAIERQMAKLAQRADFPQRLVIDVSVGDANRRQLGQSIEPPAVASGQGQVQP